MPLRLSRSATRGFTLVELLASIAIASIIMIVLLGFMQQSTSTYQESQRAVAVLSDARAFIKFFDTELSSRMVGTPLIYEGSSANDQIAFVRAQSFDEQQIDDGDLQTAVYYVAYTKDQGNRVSPKLFRHFLDAQKTQDLLDAHATTGTPPPMPQVTTTTDEPILFNVVEFKAQPKYYDASGKPQDWTSSRTEKPALIELSIKATDDGTAARFPNEPSWAKLRNSNTDDAKKNVRTYTRTIQLSQ